MSLLAYAYLRSGIICGRVGAGERIDEHAVAAALGLSRTPVHEALQRLAWEDLVEVTPRSATRVAHLGRERVRDAWLVFDTLLRAQSDAMTGADAGALRQAIVGMADGMHHADAALFFAGEDAFYRLLARPGVRTALLAAKGQVDRARVAAGLGARQMTDAMLGASDITRAIETGVCARVTGAVAAQLARLKAAVQSCT